MLTLFHGSNSSFEIPSLAYARDKRDFGVGFYTTLLRSQACDWARNMFARYGGKAPCLYTLELDESGLSVLTFPEISVDWLEMVKTNRLLGGIQHNYDIVMGPVANDNTLRTVSLYVAGVYDAQDAMKRLRYFKTNNQVSLHTEAALNKLVLKAREQLD